MSCVWAGTKRSGADPGMKELTPYVTWGISLPAWRAHEVIPSLKTSTCLVATWGNTKYIYKSQYPVCNFHMSAKTQPWTLIPKTSIGMKFLQRSNTSKVPTIGVKVFIKKIPILVPSWHEVSGGNPCWLFKQTSWSSCEEVFFKSGPVLLKKTFHKSQVRDPW